MRYVIDGNQVCCTYHNFRNLQQDPAGFGDSLKDAFIDLIKQRPLKRHTELKPWEAVWVQEDHTDNPTTAEIREAFYGWSKTWPEQVKRYAMVLLDRVDLTQDKLEAAEAQIIILEGSEDLATKQAIKAEAAIERVRVLEQKWQKLYWREVACDYMAIRCANELKSALKQEVDDG